MNFTLKALVAAVALVAAGSANAYSTAASGNGSLVFVLADTTTNNFMLYALPSTLNDFVPTSGSSVANVQATGVDTTFNLTSSVAFQSFSAASTNTANWSWSVIAMDDSPGTAAGIVTAGGRRYLTTLDNAKGTPNVSSSNFGALKTAQIDINLDGVDEMYSGAGNFVSVLGNTWLGRVTQGIGNAYGQSSSFFYLTGQSGTALSSAIVDTTGATAHWAFGAGNVLGFTTSSVVAVPESDTSAMLLAGLGVMGLVARRRLAA